MSGPNLAETKQLQEWFCTGRTYRLEDGDLSRIEKKSNRSKNLFTSTIGL